MAEVNDSRFCSICEQIVPREQQGVKIKVSPSRTILLHEGCGKIVYDAEKCIGCKLCIKVCPCGAIEFKEKEKKVKFYLSRCCFCSQCNDVCPTKCISMSDEFLLTGTDPYEKDLIVE